MKIILDYQVPTTTVGHLHPGEIYALCTHFNDVLLQTGEGYKNEPTLFMRCFDNKPASQEYSAFRREYFSVCLHDGRVVVHAPNKKVRKMYGTLTVTVTDKPEPEED